MALVLALQGSLGCDWPGARQSARRAHEGANAAAAAGIVNGETISVAEVKGLAAGSTLSAVEALRRLEAERLLMKEAERRGVSTWRSVQGVSQQALVQGLLIAEERAVVISQEQLQAAYEEQKERFQKPERRASVHILAHLPKDASPEADAAGKAFAESMLVKLAQAEDVNALLQAQQGQSTPMFKVIAERLPGFSLKSPVAKPYLDALFAAAAPGAVSAPARTTYGWHAIRVTEIVPEEFTPLKEVEATLREELLLKAREQRINDLLAQLREQHPVVIEPEVGKLLATLPP